LAIRQQQLRGRKEDPRLTGSQPEQFRDRHRIPPILLLPYSCDTMSARVFVAASFDEVATRSVGADDEQIPWAEVVTATAGIVRAARVPVTADIEAGCGETPDTLAPAMTQAEARRLFIRS